MTPPAREPGGRTADELVPKEMRYLTPAQLRQAIDNTLADMALADKYEHNAPLRQPIRDTYDRLTAELASRPCHVVELDGAYKCLTHGKLWGAVTNPDTPCTPEDSSDGR